MAGLLCLLCVVTFIMALEIQSGFLKAPYLVITVVLIYLSPSAVHQHHRDVRMARCHDALNDIRSLRMTGWCAIPESLEHNNYHCREDIASGSVNDARKQEMSYRAKRMYLDSAAISLANGACTY